MDTLLLILKFVILYCWKGLGLRFHQVHICQIYFGKFISWNMLGETKIINPFGYLWLWIQCGIMVWNKIHHLSLYSPLGSATEVILCLKIIQLPHIWGKCKHLTLSWWRPLSYRNQSIDLQSNSMEWFLYNNGLRHERVKLTPAAF